LAVLVERLWHRARPAIKRFFLTKRLRGTAEAKGQAMTQNEQAACYGFDVSARSRCNSRGAWIAHVEIHHEGRLFATCSPDTVQPEWLTEAESNRDGIERGCRFVGHMVNDRQDRSWVALRERAEQWFFTIEATQEAEQILRELAAR
jgi:hypothetical protein